MKKLVLLSMVLMLVVAFVPTTAAQDTQTPTEICAAATPAEDPETRSFDAAEEVLEADVDYYAIFCTDVGPIYIDLYESETPETVNNFVFLSEAGYYNNSIFHRVIDGFMAQAGDPVGDPVGTGGPGYQFNDEIVEELRFDRGGLLAMANAGPGTNGSQFFITYDATPWLDGAHTIFGEVVVGQNVANSILLRDPSAPEPNPATALETVVIVTDPASVEAVEYVPPPATREEIEAAFANLVSDTPTVLDAVTQGLSTIVAIDAESTGVFEVADWAAQLPADIQDAYTAYAEATGVAYHAQGTMSNQVCDLTSLPVQQFAYGFDVFESADAAQAALESDALVDLLAAQDFANADLNVPDYTIYTTTTSACDTEDLVFARAIQRQGRFLVFSDVVFVSGSLSDSDADAITVLTTGFNPTVFSTSLRGILAPEVE